MQRHYYVDAIDFTTVEAEVHPQADERTEQLTPYQSLQDKPMECADSIELNHLANPNAESTSTDSSMYSFIATDSSLSKNLTTGSHNKLTTATHISSYIHRDSSFCCFVIIVSILCIVLPLALCVTTVTLFLTLPYSPEGSAVLGTSSVTLLLTLN